VIVALGDHGEGFGDKGIRQHDNHFFEEGLHVPWVMAGPGVPHAAIGGDASLVDVTPTLLELLGLPMVAGAAASTPGRSLLGGPPRGRRLLPFSCWYDERCRGFVDGGRKVVFVPEAGTAFWFDLAADPDEREPRRLTAELAGRLEEAHRLIDSHRTPAWPDDRAPMNDYAPWTCPADQPCRHPRSPAKGLFTAP
jgi:arylsulfatase A-like enzyme